MASLGGVQKLIRDNSPKAYYLHCYAHRLILVLIDTTKVVRQADDFFSLLEQLYIFISNSIVHENFVKLQKEMHHGEKIRELESLSETRWWARATSCKNVLTHFECIISRASFLLHLFFEKLHLFLKKLQKVAFIFGKVAFIFGKLHL